MTGDAMDLLDYPFPSMDVGEMHLGGLDVVPPGAPMLSVLALPILDGHPLDAIVPLSPLFPNHDSILMTPPMSPRALPNPVHNIVPDYSVSHTHHLPVIFEEDVPTTQSSMILGAVDAEGTDAIDGILDTHGQNVEEVQEMEEVTGPQEVTTFIRMGDVILTPGILNALEEAAASLRKSGSIPRTQPLPTFTPAGHLNLAIFFDKFAPLLVNPALTTHMTVPFIDESQSSLFKPKRGTTLFEHLYRSYRDFRDKKALLNLLNDCNERFKVVLGLFECPLKGCPFVTKCEKGYDSHLFLHLPPTLLCPNCGDPFVRDADFEEHILGEISCVRLVVEDIGYLLGVDYAPQIGLAMQLANDDLVREALLDIIPFDLEASHDIAEWYRAYPSSEYRCLIYPHRPL